MREEPEGRIIRAIELNYQGNDAEVLFSRLQTPEIRQQVCELIDKLDKSSTIDNEEDPLTLSRQDIETQYDTQLEGMQRITPISYGREPWHSSERGIAFQSVDPVTGQKFTTKQLSIVEAHEKGHLIRPYNGPQYDEYFRQGFDITRLTIPDSWLKVGRRILATELKTNDGKESVSPEAARSAVIDYLFSGPEIAERMNQLKNYFGFRGTEQFTKEHLDVARKHYVTDTGFSDMDIFLQAITAETENKFLHLINTSGI